MPTESRSSLGVSGTENSTDPNGLIQSNRACEMHQTQTFVHLIILLVPRAHCEPQPLKSIAVRMLLKIPIAIRPTSGSRHGSEESSKRPSRFARNLQCPYVLACGNQTQARFQRGRGRGAYEIGRLEKHPPSPRPRLCPGDLFIPVVSIGVSCPEPGNAACHGQAVQGQTAANRRNSSESRELGRQCDFSGRCGAGGRHGRRLLFARPRSGALGGQAADCW